MSRGILIKYALRIAAGLALCWAAAPAAAQDQALYAQVRDLTAQAAQQNKKGDELNIGDPAGSCAAYNESDKLLGQAVTKFKAFMLTYPAGPKDKMEGGLGQLTGMQGQVQGKAKGICSKPVAATPKSVIVAAAPKPAANLSREGKAKLACETQKDFQACTTFGVALIKGAPDVPQNLGNAVAYFRFACDGGDALGCRNLAHAQEDGIGTTTDMAAAVTNFGEACKGGDKDSCVYEWSAKDKIEVSVAGAFKSKKIDAAIANETQLALEKGYKLLFTSQMLRNKSITNSAPQNFALADYLVFAVCDEACTDVSLTAEHSLTYFASEPNSAQPATQRLVAFRPTIAGGGNVRAKVKGCSVEKCYARFVIFQRPSANVGRTPN